MTPTTPSSPPAQLCDRCRHDLTADQRADALGFGFSRDTEPDRAPVPDGVVLIFLTGRTPRDTR
jgi:hypothetical protein